MSMAAPDGPVGGDFQRPYTIGTFQSKLNSFQNLIRQITYQDAEATPEERRQWISENLRFDQFCEKIRELFGSDVKNQDLKSVYRKISTNPDAKVDWSELFGYFQSRGEDEELSAGEEVSIFMVSKRRRVGEAAGDRRRRDSVQNIRYVQALDSYIASSQKGAISIWNSKLRLQSCVILNEPAWVTGCDYLPGIRRVACCTERSIAIWDSRGKGKSQQVFIIKPIEHSPQCMTYVPNQSSPLEDLVLFGDDQGYVNALTIGPNDLNIKNAKGEKSNSQNIVIEPSKLSNSIVRRKVHGDWVLKIKYFPDLRCFASCSPNRNLSFVLEEPERLFDNGEIRGASVPKGVNCFDYCSRANIIATGGVDKIIRVWHPHIFSRPTGKLMGHLFTIIDIACNEKDQHIISLSTARVFRVWDIHTLSCLQVFTDNEERPGEKRIYSMTFDNKHERLLTGSSVIDAWPLTRSVQDTMQVPHTHDRAVVQILSNKELKQVVSVCTESVIKVWEMDSGKLVYSIPEAHGPSVEVTAIALDRSGYRLITGAFDGSLKVWDFGAGQVIKTKSGKKTDEDLSITGLLYQRYSQEDHILVASGWTNKIRLLLDSNDSNDLTLFREFNDVYYWTREASLTLSGIPPLPDIGQPNAQVTSVFRKDYLLSSHEVTCMTSVDSNLIATGCNNGDIILWNIEKAAVEKVLALPPPEVLGEKTRRRMRQAGEMRVNCLRVLIHKVKRMDPAVVGKPAGFHRLDTAVDNGADDKAVYLQACRTRRSVVSWGQEENEQVAEKSGPVLRELSAKLQRKETVQESVNTGNKTQPEEGNDEIRHRWQEGALEAADVEEVKATKTGNGDSDAKMIVDAFDPVLVSVHQDACMRFWDVASGEIIRTVSPLTGRQGVPVTAVCHNADVNLLVTGDNKGYLTLWDCRAFMEDPTSTETGTLKQVICWRAHLTKVVSLDYVDSLKAILSSSTDGSVRVWWGCRGRFVGFFGQHRPFSFPDNEEKAGTPTLPYDITERPLAPVKRQSATQRIQKAHKFESPLVFDKQRWEPFRRSAYNAKRAESFKPEEKKFFQALIKPKAYNSHLESFITAEKSSGAVFRALPVYRVRTPKRLKKPEMGCWVEENEQDIFGSSQAQKRVRTRTKHPLPSVTVPRLKAVYLALQGVKAFRERGSKRLTSHHKASITTARKSLITRLPSLVNRTGGSVPAGFSPPPRLRR